tara:strand:- start:1229 stop:1411 length:183 start_codon:yes stop_codon:yes gene_type:complete
MPRKKHNELDSEFIKALQETYDAHEESGHDHETPHITDELDQLEIVVLKAMMLGNSPGLN